MKSNLEVIRGLETELLRPDVRSNPGRVADLLAEDYLEIGESGRRYAKSDVLEALKTEAGTDFTIDNFTAIPFGPDTVLATYLVRKFIRKSRRESSSRRSSLWRRSDGCWKMVFHQGTAQRTT